MKVILIKDVKNQGKKDQILDVSDGYAENYLIKNKLAVKYTPESKKVLDTEIKERQDKEDALVESLNVIKKRLEGKTLTFKVKTGKDDRVFGSISSKQICELLSKQGEKIDKKCIYLDSQLDALGYHDVTIKLHKKVEFKIKIYLVK